MGADWLQGHLQWARHAQSRRGRSLSCRSRNRLPQRIRISYQRRNRSGGIRKPGKPAAVTSSPAEPGVTTNWTPRLSRAGWEAITNPRRIALVGASGRESSVSFTSRFLQTNDELGFTGDIFLINPARSEIMGRKCWPNLAALPECADMVAINLPDEKVLPAVEEAIAHGARALMIHSGGFLERGSAGAERQQRLQRLCADARLPALGPNCLGFLSFTNRVSISSFKISANTAGSVAAISQSGSVASLLQAIAGRHGLSLLASTGNEAVTSVEDLIAYAIEDP